MKTLFVLLMTGFALNGFASSSQDKGQSFEVKVTKKGFEPSSIKAKSHHDVTLRVTRTTDSTCAKKINVPSKKISLDLPLNKEIDVQLGKLEKGDIRFGCGMSMMVGGVVSVE